MLGVSPVDSPNFKRAVYPSQIIFQIFTRRPVVNSNHCALTFEFVRVVLMGPHTGINLIHRQILRKGRPAIPHTKKEHVLFRIFF